MRGGKILAATVAVKNHPVTRYLHKKPKPVIPNTK
jgi:hypothetical protein